MLTTRYLIKNLFFATLFVAVTLTLVIWLTQSLKLLDLVANSDAPPGLFIKLVFLTMPRFLEIILPLSLVVGILFVYNKMLMDNELVVLRSCGFDQMTLARPALILAGGMTLLLLAMTTYISPRTYTEMQVLRQSIKTQYSSFLLREGVFNTFGNNLTVYLRARESNGDLLGLVIHDTRDKNKPPVTITAKRGSIVMNDDVPNILVFNGMRQQMDEDSKVTSKLYFSRYTIEIKGLETNPSTRWREPSERTLPELLNPDMSNKRDRNNRDMFLAEANHRVVTPFNAIAFALTCLTALLLGPFNRRGQSRKIIVAAALVIVLEALNLIFVNASKKNLGLIPVIPFLTLSPIIACLLLLRGPGEQWVMRRLRNWRLRDLRKHPPSGSVQGLS